MVETKCRLCGFVMTVGNTKHDCFDELLNQAGTVSPWWMDSMQEVREQFEHLAEDWRKERARHLVCALEVGAERGEVPTTKYLTKMIRTIFELGVD